MPTILIEDTRSGTLTFEFADNWRVCKYDELASYHAVNGLGIKGVDFIALSANRLVFIEAKYVIANDSNSRLRFSASADNEIVKTIKETLSPEQQKLITIQSARPYLVDEVVKKIRDVLTVLLASYRNQDPELLPYSQVLFTESNLPISVLLFLERKAELNQKLEFKPLASQLKLAIEQKLSFLGNIQIDVLNTLTLPNHLGIKVNASLR
ncbi:MAG: hypothetical protein WAX77_03625 [Methylococcaceae bacterium]